MSFPVSPYFPERNFPFNVFDRLEAVMDISISSILAKYSTKLASESGMRHESSSGFNIHLQESSKNLNEVISQWFEGHSHRHPTWKNLLAALHEIDLKKLSNQIEDFMRGK